MKKPEVTGAKFDQNTNGDVGRASYTLDEICARSSMSKSTMNILRRSGRGPKLTFIGRLVRVTAEAEREWLKALQNPPPDEAERIRAEREHYSEIGRLAGRASAAKQHHISKVNKRAAEKNRLRRQPEPKPSSPTAQEGARSDDLRPTGVVGKPNPEQLQIEALPTERLAPADTVRGLLRQLKSKPKEMRR
jgi:hypothetical protein